MQISVLMFSVLPITAFIDVIVVAGIFPIIFSVISIIQRVKVLKLKVLNIEIGACFR